MINWVKFYEKEASFKQFNPDADISVLTRLKLVNRLLKNTNYSSVLDVGCGDGLLLKKYKKDNCDFIVGIDISLKRLKDTHAVTDNAILVKCDGKNLPFKENKFDLATSTETIEHIPEFRESLKEMGRVAGKYILITVPNQEEVRKIICPHCLNEFLLDGHLHTFSASDFLKREIDGYKVDRIETSFLMSRIGLFWKISSWIIRRLFPDYVLNRGQFLGVLFRKI